jgi:hypothetical protein
LRYWSRNDLNIGGTIRKRDEMQIKDCPPYGPDIPVNREYDEQLYDFYGRPKYWL